VLIRDIKKKIVVGMSGGVDSSVTALLLKQQGYEVIGLFMRNWEESGPACPAEQDYEDVLRVAKQIDIPCYPVNLARHYWDHVFKIFVDELSQGFTPNPDILCNREIKFNFFLQKALDLGAEAIATGHYARKGMRDGKASLLKGLDSGKDQSYFLYTLNSSILEKVLFPIGDLPKSEVRRIAKEAGLATAEKRDSTGICFIGKRDFREFLSGYLPYRPGAFRTLSGETVGEHLGVAYYTIGQRKGIGLGGPGDAWFVVGKIVEENVVLVERGVDHPALYASALTATEASWVVAPPQTFPYRCQAKIRYRQEDEECEILSCDGEQLTVRFSRPQRAIAPRQSIVFYQGDECLGGAMIKKPITLQLPA